MDLTQSLNLNTATQKPLFDPTYLNLEYIFNKILEFFRSIFGYGLNDSSVSSSPSPFLIFYFILAVFFLFVISYCTVRLFEIRKKQKEVLKHKIEEYARHQEEEAKTNGSGNFRNQRWEHVLEYLSSSNPSDWKLAVMEADAMLEDLTDQLEMEGENLGERLKASNKEKFKSLDDAWEAHLIRNRIAHEGSQFDLSQHEANRVITLYENVFREFGHI